MTSRTKIGRRAATFLPGVVFLLSLAACSSISPSTVQLSADVGSRIAEMQRLHLEAVHSYFAVERQKIEDFLTDEWEPLFLRNFLATSDILNKLKNVSQFSQSERSELVQAMRLYVDSTQALAAVDALIPKLDAERSGEPAVIRSTLSQFGLADPQLEAATVHVTSLLGTDTAGHLMILWAEAAHGEMRKRRQSLLDPLARQEQQVAAELGAAYGQILAGQSAITGRLEAASRVSQEREQLFQSLGVGNLAQDVQNRLADLSGKLDQGLSVARTALNNAEGTNALDAILQALTPSTSSSVSSPAN